MQPVVGIRSSRKTQHEPNSSRHCTYLSSAHIYPLGLRLLDPVNLPPLTHLRKIKDAFQLVAVAAQIPQKLIQTESSRVVWNHVVAVGDERRALRISITTYERVERPFTSIKNQKATPVKHKPGKNLLFSLQKPHARLPGGRRWGSVRHAADAACADVQGLTQRGGGNGKHLTYSSMF